MLKFALSAAVAASMIAPAAAGNFVVQPRAEIAYAYIDADTASFNAVGARLGIDFVKFFGVEGEVFTGVTDDEDGAVTFSLNYKAGVYGVGRFPIAPAVNLFARAGVVQAEAEAEFAGQTGDDSESGVAFGVGVNGGLVGTPLGWRGDYTRTEIDDFESDEFSLALVYRF